MGCTFHFNPLLGCRVAWASSVVCHHFEEMQSLGQRWSGPAALPLNGKFCGCSYLAEFWSFFSKGGERLWCFGELQWRWAGEGHCKKPAKSSSTAWLQLLHQLRKAPAVLTPQQMTQQRILSREGWLCWEPRHQKRWPCFASTPRRAARMELLTHGSRHCGKSRRKSVSPQP